MVATPACRQSYKLAYIQVYFSYFLRGLAARLRLAHPLPLGVSVLIGDALAQGDRAHFDALRLQPGRRVLVPGSGRADARRRARVGLPPASRMISRVAPRVFRSMREG